jgi:alkanesulfonate monooxygenase SsuD/methylene tetrahydromethanopterin reductase-like flavin-dependent oxidoreductase (luciferase family)
VRDLARNTYGRTIQVWTNCYCVIADTDAEAKRILDYAVKEKGDWVAVDNIARSLGVQTQILPKEAIEGFKYHFIAGWGGYPLVGTAETVAREIGRLAKAGVDGSVMSWPRYEEGLGRFIAEVLPLLEQQGLRAPFVPSAMAAE